MGLTYPDTGSCWLTCAAIDDADSIIRTFHLNLHSNEDHPLLPNLTPQEKAKFAEAEKGLQAVKEGRQLEEEVDRTEASPAKRRRAEVTA